LEPLDIDMSNVVDMFDNASKKLKRPKVTFERFRLERNNDGSISARGYETYFGVISVDGKFYPTQDITEEITEDIKNLSEDPVRFACEYGKATGRCCFCMLPLKEERSLGVGYGPICARNYKMPWGKKKATTVDILAEST
jgi:hypothetical protein